MGKVLKVDIPHGLTAYIQYNRIDKLYSIMENNIKWQVEMFY